MFNITIYTCLHVNSTNEMEKIKTNGKEVNKIILACLGILLQSLGIEYRSKKHPYIPMLDLDM